MSACPVNASGALAKIATIASATISGVRHIDRSPRPHLIVAWLSIIVAGHMAIAAPASDGDTTCRWMQDGERLIRSRAKYELAINYGVDYPDLAQRMHPETGACADAYSELKQVASKLTGRGRITPTGF